MTDGLDLRCSHQRKSCFASRDPPAWPAELGIDSDADERFKVAPKQRGCTKPSRDALPYQTTNAKVFAGCDGVRGADLVVTAVQEGRDAAEGIAGLLLG